MCGCSSDSDLCGCNSTVLPTGSTGDDGAQGVFGGYSLEWVYNTTITPTPAITQLRFNSLTPTAITEIYVSDIEINSQSAETFLNSLVNSNNFGYVKIFKTSDSSKFWLGKLTGVVDSGTYHTLTVTYLGWNLNGSFPFTSADNIVLTFSPTGPQGPDVLYNTTTAVSTANMAKTILQTYTLLADQLSTNGDIIEIVGLFSTNTTTGLQFKNIDVRIGGTVCHTKVTDFSMFSGTKYVRVCIKATRMSATTLFLDFKTFASNDLYQDVTGGTSFFETGFSVSNLTSNTTAIELRANNTLGTGETITAEQMTVTYIKKS